MKFRFLTASAVVLAGCSSIVPETLALLAGVSPLDADPANFAVALDVPDGVGVLDGSTVLSLDAARADTGQILSGRYILDPGTSPDGSRTYRVAETDLDALRQLQAQINAWETSEPEATSGSLSVTLTPCQIGNGPAQGAVVSAAIQVEQGGAFMPLVRDVPVVEFLNRSGTTKMPFC